MGWLFEKTSRLESCPLVWEQLMRFVNKINKVVFVLCTK